MYKTEHSYIWWFGVALFVVTGILSAIDGVPNGFEGFLQHLVWWTFLLGIIATFLGVFDILYKRS